MRIYYTDQFVLPLPAGHRFPMEKYSLLRRRIIESRIVPPTSLRVPPAVSDDALSLVHDDAFVNRVSGGMLEQDEVRRIGFPWSRELVERSRRSVGATLAACRSALTEGIGVNLAGGTHHAFPDHGEGFCVFNDAGVAARVLQAERAVDQVLVVDCDVHQGNGTARMFADDPTVFTFDLCAAHNFPFTKEAGDLVISLEDGVGDAEYLGALHAGLREALERVRPDVAIYLSGADPYEGDRLGRLAVSKQGLAERDRIVIGMLRERNIPVAVTMSGGYATDIRDTVDIHFHTVCTAAALAAGHSMAADSPRAGAQDTFV